MNQRSRNRRSHAAVPFCQLVERSNGRRIAQNHGDLSATGNAGGLALGAGLGLGHLFAAHPKSVVGALRRHIVNVGVIHAWVMLADTHDCGVARLLRMLGRNLIDDHFLPLGCAGLDGGKADAVEVHGLLRSGAIPPMCESYAVTSDVSTTILQVFA